MFHIDIHPGASLGILYDDDNIHDNSDVHGDNDVYDDDDTGDTDDNNAHIYMCLHTQP